jgi:hypothetical protein
MIPRSPSVFLLVLILCLSIGCRDSWPVEPRSFDVGESNPFPYREGDPYLKGPDRLRVGQETTYAIPGIAGAARYEWVVLGSSLGRLSTAYGTQRHFRVQATGPGNVDLQAAAYDADGRTLAMVRRRVHVAY